MNKKLLNNILHISFRINVIFLVAIIGQMIYMILNPQLYIETITNPDYKLILMIAFYALFVPVLFLWVYNIWFLLRYDRYSSSFIPLIFLGIIYSPFYYYNVNIKKRPLKNIIESKPGKTIQLEEYQNEQEYQQDIEDNNEKPENEL